MEAKTQILFRSENYYFKVQKINQYKVEFSAQNRSIGQVLNLGEHHKKTGEILWTGQTIDRFAKKTINRLVKTIEEKYGNNHNRN